MALPLNSSSLSFRRNCKCVLSPSSAFIRFPSWALRFRSFSKSALIRASRSCSSARERCASVRSVLVAANASCREESGCPGRCPAGLPAGDVARVCCWASAEVGTAFAVRSASWVSDRSLMSCQSEISVKGEVCLAYRHCTNQHWPSPAYLVPLERRSIPLASGPFDRRR